MKTTRETPGCGAPGAHADELRKDYPVVVAGHPVAIRKPPLTAPSGKRVESRHSRNLKSPSFAASALCFPILHPASRNVGVIRTDNPAPAPSTRSRGLNCVRITLFHITAVSAVASTFIKASILSAMRCEGSRSCSTVQSAA